MSVLCVVRGTWWWCGKARRRRRPNLQFIINNFAVKRSSVSSTCQIDKVFVIRPGPPSRMMHPEGHNSNINPGDHNSNNYDMNPNLQSTSNPVRPKDGFTLFAAHIRQVQDGEEMRTDSSGGTGGFVTTDSSSEAPVNRATVPVSRPRPTSVRVEGVSTVAESYTSLEKALGTDNTPGPHSIPPAEFSRVPEGQQTLWSCETDIDGKYDAVCAKCIRDGGFGVKTAASGYGILRLFEELQERFGYPGSFRDNGFRFESILLLSKPGEEE